MPHPLPPAVQALAKETLPPQHRMWWVRGRVLDVQQVERPLNDPKLRGLFQDLQLQVSDADAPGDGYEFRIEGIHHSVELGDVVSLVGHEPADAKRISQPRLCVNHNTGSFDRVYPAASRLPYGVLPVVERKYWLAAKTPADARGKFKNLWILLAALSLPSFAIGFVAGPLAGILVGLALLILASPFIIAFALIGFYLRWLLNQPRFSTEEKELPPLILKNVRDYTDFHRFDLTALYEKIARVLHPWMLQHPEPQKKLVPVERGAHTVGLLEPAPAQIAAAPAPANPSSISIGPV